MFRWHKYITALRAVSASLLPLILSAALSAQSGSIALPVDSTIRIGTLPNGMKYYIRRNARPEHRAELRLAVHAGSLQEENNQQGLAHFVEHMAFNGSAHFEKNELVDYLEHTGARFGPDLNAYTSFEETVYLLQVRTDSLEMLEKGLLILEDWANGLSFDSTEIEKERGVVLSEWRTRLSPDERLQQKYFPVQYKDSRYAERLPIGKPEIIQTADAATIRSFYDDWYRPNLMAVVAVGDFDPVWMEQQIIRRFSTLKNPATPRPREDYPVPAHEGTLYVTATDPEAPFSQVQVIYKHPHHRVVDEESYRKQLAISLYNRMLNARLVEVQHQPGPPFTFAYSGYGSDIGDLDAYSIYAFVKEGGVLEGLESVMKATRRAMLHGFTPSELERKKADMLEEARRAYREQDKRESGVLASRCANHFLDGGLLISPGQQLQLYETLLPAITLSDINLLPRAWFTDQNRVVIVTGPEKEASPMPAEEALQALLARLDTLSLEPYIDVVNDAPLVSEVLEPAPFQSEEQLDSLGITKLKLPNGITIYLKPTDFKNDEVLMSAFSPGGHSVFDDDAYYSAANAAAILSQSGLGAFTLAELEKKLSGNSANAGAYISELYEGLSGSSSPEDLETLLQLTYLYFTAPRRDEVALQSFLARQRSVFENMMANPYYYFADIRNQVKYKGHPRRQITTLEGLDKISIDEVMRTYQGRFSDAGDFTFIFVGSFDEEKLRPLLMRYLGNLPTTGRVESWRDVGAQLIAKADTVIVRGQAPKALVELTYHGDFEYANPQARYDFYAMAAALRIRLREALREDKGGVYGVSLNGVLLPYPKPEYRLTLSFNSEPERAQELIEAAKAEIRQMQETGPPEDVLEKVRETQRQNRIKGLKENSFWLGQISTRLQHGIPLEGILLNHYEPYIDGLNPQSVKEMAQQCFVKNRLIQMVLMPD
ncbi:MAG: insulinase family protein [Lewinellaceae bacterium]|nr:insulinase family protein [Lewinellaceae bacterium]